MRGSLSLFGEIFDKPVAAVQDVVIKKKGRSAEFHAKRNELLVARYYFYCQFTDRRYSKVISDLSDEFFLSVVTIPELLTENSQALKELANAKPIKNYFSKKWPHLVW